MDPLEQTTRSAFLDLYFADKEAGTLRPVEGYVALFPGVADFVRAEYSRLETTSAYEASAAPEPGPSIGRYRVDAKIGEGGMGVVYRGVDPHLDRPVVLKMLRWHGILGESATVRLRREAKVLGRLEHHGLCQVLDLVEEDGQVTVVMPFFEGVTLADVLDRARHAKAGGRGAWPEITGSEAGPCTRPTGSSQGAGDIRPLIEFVAKVADAVHVAHEVGIVHRDLKPQNIIVQPGGEPVVLDFGLALDEQMAEGDRVTLSGDIVGTPLYMAPEQIERHDVDRRCDIYALGVILYEMLTLARPFEGSTRQSTYDRILRGGPVAPRKRNPLIPRDLEAVCLKALDRDPGRRYREARMLAEDLRRVLLLRPTIARPASGIERLYKRFRRNPVRYSLAVALVIAVGLAISFSIRAAMRGRTLDYHTAAIALFTGKAGPKEVSKLDELFVDEAARSLFDQNPNDPTCWARLRQRLDELPRSASRGPVEWRTISPRGTVVEVPRRFVFDLPATHEADEPADPGFEMWFRLVIRDDQQEEVASFAIRQGVDDGGRYEFEPDADLQLDRGQDYSWTVLVDERHPEPLRNLYQPGPAGFRLASKSELDVSTEKPRAGDADVDALVRAARLLAHGRWEAADSLLTSLGPAEGPLEVGRLRLWAEAKVGLGDALAFQEIHGRFLEMQPRTGSQR